MATRLNNVIQIIEHGGVAFGPFMNAGSIPEAVWAASSPYDAVVFEMEHSAFDLSALRLSLQFMLDRRQIHQAGSLSPAVVPIVRVPINGREHVEWIVKQVLDLGVYGIVFPMINTVEDAVHALSACRYIQATGAPDQEPKGRRGHAPGNAMRYWGLSQAEYFDRADIWPADPQGEILPLLQCETIEAVNNLPKILEVVKKPGLILISESDLSVSMGFKAQGNAEVDAAVQQAVRACRAAGVPYGSPQANANNMQKRIDDGFQFLMPAPGRDLSALELGKRLAKR